MSSASNTTNQQKARALSEELMDGEGEMQVVVSLVSVVVGAVLTAALQQFFWKRQQQSMEERERKRERETVAQHLRDVGSLLIEISREALDGSKIDRSQLPTAMLIETYRLRREFLTALTAVRATFRDDSWKQRLDALAESFQSDLLQRVGSLSDDKADFLRTRLDTITADLNQAG